MLYKYGKRARNFLVLSYFYLTLLYYIMKGFLKESVREKTSQNQAGGGKTQITDFAQTWHKC